MLSRANRIYFDYPDPVKGYELNTERGLFSVIIPEATVNLVLNPSFGNGSTTGYTGYSLNEIIAAITTWQAYGSYGLRITPVPPIGEVGVIYGTFSATAGVTYTGSVTLQGEPGKIYYIWFANGGTLVGTKQIWIGTGHKQRIWVTYTEATGGNRQIIVTRDARYTDLHAFYVDGFQVEVKNYPTTYCDGDQVGFVTGELAYYWNGTPHASGSTRSAQTRSGGKEVNLLEFGLHILAIVGLGMAPLVDRSLTIPGLGEVPQETGTMAREFTIIGAVDSIAGQRNLKELRSGLIDAFKPDLTVNDQPLILRYQEYDGDDVCGDSLDIICKYRGGLEGQWDNNHGERLALNFKMYLPLIQSTFSKGTSLGFQNTVANANSILQRGTDWKWAAMGTGLAGVPAYPIAFVEAPDGTIYIGGTFTGAGGVADTVYIAKWNGTVWAPLATGANSFVYALAVAPDGTLYAAGNFTNLGGASGDYIAKWDGANWTALGTGANGAVWALTIDNAGNLWAGGAFTSMSGVANTSRIAKWDGANWTAAGTGAADNVVFALKTGIDGSIYAGGSFTLMGGIAGTAYLAKWDGSAWSELGSGVDNIVNALAIGKDGSIYAGGSLTVAGGITVGFIARWNGSAWFALGSGLNGIAQCIAIDGSGMVYVGGRL